MPKLNVEGKSSALPKILSARKVSENQRYKEVDDLEYGGTGTGAGSKDAFHQMLSMNKNLQKQDK